MDLSKLPKLSNTTQPPPPQESPTPSQPIQHTSPAAPPNAGIGAEVWFNIFIAVLVLYFGHQFGVYLFDRATGREFDTGMQWPNGDPVQYYSQVQNFQMLSDGGVFTFGLVILLEALVKAWYGIRHRVPLPISTFALFFAIAGTLLNIYVCFELFSISSTPIVSLLAVAYGGYIVFDLLAIQRASAIKLANAAP